MSFLFVGRLITFSFHSSRESGDMTRCCSTRSSGNSLLGIR
uniref:Uncharacterized protein n=1 Tax=Setaria italica TaxID=4555 RepID=K3XUC2_SETIT